MELSRIDLFPIKSLDGVSVARARINRAGTLEHDRVYAIVDAAGAYVNGKRTNRVHLIRTTFAEDYREASFWIQGETQKQSFVLKEPGRINRWLSDFFGFAVQFICEPINGFADDRAASGPVAGLLDVTIGETIASVDDPQPLPVLEIDEPTLRMTFGVNTSPMAGREGRYVTSRHLKARRQHRRLPRRANRKAPRHCE